MTFANFHDLGNVDVLNMLVNINLRGRTMESSHRRIIFPVIISGPLDLLESMFRRSGSTSSSRKVMLDKKLFVRAVKGGNVLSFVLGLHCFEKNSLKRLALTLQFMTNLLLNLSGGIFGALDLFMKFLMIFQ